MKILTISATDRLGGAGIAAYRSHQALLRAGVDAQMLVWRKITADSSIQRLSERLGPAQRWRRRLAERRHRRQLRLNPRGAEAEYWSLNSFAYPIADVINRFDVDLVHLHWIGDNFLPIAELARIKAPVVWTLHDMWAFTGGCHYARECLRYHDGCGSCPQLLTSAADDISARVIRSKLRAWKKIPFTVVCPSHWLADCAAASAVLQGKRIEVIPNPIDHSVFQPLDRQAARRAFNLPLDRRLALFGAVGGSADRRKGFKYLREALGGLCADAGIELVVFGAEGAEAPDPGLPIHQIGSLRDEVSLAMLYNACDVYVAPSLQENLPNTLMEALACGMPCVAFDAGGVGDLLQHRQNGYLARWKDADDLRRGIEWTLAQSWYADALHQQSVDRHSFEQISAQTIRLYESLIGTTEVNR